MQFYPSGNCESALYNLIDYSLNRYYCLAAAAALVKYVEFTQNMILAPASINVIFSGCENTTMIGKNLLYEYTIN